MAMTSAVVLIGLIAAEVLPRLVVRRAQPYRSPALLVADDALRSWSAHAVVGALLASMLMLVSGQLWSLGGSSTLMLMSWVFQPSAFVVAVVALASVQLLSGYEWRWRVARTVHRPS